MFVGAQIDKFAASNPQKLALVSGRDEVTWQDLCSLVERLANWLEQETPLGSGIAMVLTNSTALPLLVLATARCGRVAQVLDPAWPDAMIQQTVSRMDSAMIFTMRGRSLTGSKSINGHEPIELDDVSPLESLKYLVRNSLPHNTPRARAELSFYIGFTSGSTGHPKGYRRNHASWVESFKLEAIEFGHCPGDVVVAPGNLSHSLFLYAIVHALHIGATAVMCHRFRPDAVLEAIDRHAGTLLYVVPAQLALVASVCRDHDPAPRNSIRRIITSGSKWHDRDRDFLGQLFPVADFAEFYGASELSFVSVARQEDDAPRGSVGRAFSGVDIVILGDNGKKQPAMASGQIFVHSPMLFETYAGCDGEPDLARKGHYLSVGDIGYLDKNGFLFLSGRKDRMIVVSGKNLFPEEIEAVLQGHPAIECAAVVALPDDKRGARLAAVVEFKKGAPLLQADIITWARIALPLYKIPRRFYRLNAWPQTRSGKIDFIRLRALLASDACERLP